MLKFYCSLFVSSGLLLVSFAANASPITITSSSIRNSANDAVGKMVNVFDRSSAYSSRSFLAVDGAASSSTDINWVDTYSGVLFDFDINQTRPGNYYAYTQTHGLYSFTANVNTSYSVSGQYSVDDVTSAGRALSYVYLRNITSGGYMYRDYRYSDNTLDKSFTVGIEREGDRVSIFTGSQTGYLIAGNEYQFHFNNYIHAYPAADGGASATGCVTLSIGGATGARSCGTPIPESMPLMLLVLGLVAFGLRGRSLAKAGHKY